MAAAPPSATNREVGTVTIEAVGLAVIAGSGVDVGLSIGVGGRVGEEVGERLGGALPQPARASESRRAAAAPAPSWTPLGGRLLDVTLE